MNVRELPFELQQKAIAELNENPKRIEQDVEDLRSWLKRQSHLKFKDDDQFLLGVLRRCKFSIEKSKKKLELYYTMKTFSPDFLMNRDPFHDAVQLYLNSKTVFVNCSLSSPTIYYILWKNVEEMGISVIDAARMFFMNIDILINEKDAFVINGLTYVMDFKDVPLQAYLKWDINLLKKFFMILNAYSLRIKQIFAINAPTIIRKIYNVVKITLSEKLRQRVLILNDMNTFYEMVPRDLLSEELGGTAGTTDKAAAQWKELVESYKSWFKEDDNYKSLEELRVGKRQSHSDIFGTEGSFRKLDCD